MKLICEQIESVNYLTEAAEDGTKKYVIEGIFMQAEIPNKNGRIYPMPIMEAAVNKYIEEKVKTRRAFGELGHPNGPQINLDRVSHLVTELKKDGTNYIGKAVLSNTPMGNTAKGIMECGGVLAVSSRGLGSLKKNARGLNEVQSDFYLAAAADIVSDPSGPNCFVNGLMEGVTFFWDNGALRAQEIAEQAVEQVEAAVRSRDLTPERQAKIFENYINSLIG